MRLRVQSDRLSTAGRAAHDIGLAAILGGNLYGRYAMHPALRGVGQPPERGLVTNRAWRRFGVFNGLALASILAGWLGARSSETRARYLTSRERTLARAKDVSVAAVTVTGTAAAVEGVRFSRMAPDGAVPLTDGSTPAAEATPDQARAKRRLNRIGDLQLVSSVALAAVSAGIAQANFRRPPIRRVLFRRY